MAFAVVIMFIIGIRTLLTTNTNEKTTSISSYYPVFTNEKWGVIDEKGNIIIEPNFEEMITIPNRNKDIFICMENVNYEENTYNVKVLNSENKEIFTGYDLVEAIENIDTSNNMWYEDNVLKVKKGELYGLIDFSGKEILEPKYQEINALKGTKNSLIIKQSDKLGLSDNKGNVIIKPEYKEIKSIENNYQNGYIVVNQENKYGIIDFTSQVIVETGYEDIKQITGNHMYVVKQDGKWKLINSKKETLIENVNDVTQILDNQYGILLVSGEEKIKPQYEELSNMFDDYYLVKKNGKYGIINSANEQVLPSEYSKITYKKDADFVVAEKENVAMGEIYNNKFEKKLDGIVSDINAEKGYIRVYVGNEYKYYNLNFDEKTAVECLQNNNLLLSKKDGKYGYINRDGNLVIDYTYEDAQELNEYGYAAVKKDGKWGAIDKTGAVVANCNYNLQENVMIDFIGKWHLSVDLNSYYYTD